MNKEQISDWREEFESFYFIESDGEWNKDMGTPSPKKIKDFIASTIQSEVDKAVKERDLQIIEIINSKRPICNNIENTPEFWINETADDIINLITSPTRATMGNGEE